MWNNHKFRWQEEEELMENKTTDDYINTLINEKRQEIYLWINDMYVLESILVNFIYSNFQKCPYYLLLEYIGVNLDATIKTSFALTL